MIADGKTIYAFVTKGSKFPQCNTFSDKSCDVKCKVSRNKIHRLNNEYKYKYTFKPVDNLNSISLGGSRRAVSTGRIYKGNDCEWIDLNKVRYVFQKSPFEIKRLQYIVIIEIHFQKYLGQY